MSERNELARVIAGLDAAHDVLIDYDPAEAGVLAALVELADGYRERLAEMAAAETDGMRVSA